MIHGVDTSYLVAVEVAGHPRHQAAAKHAHDLIQQGDIFGVAPQVLAEFLHVVTDPRRFPSPLDMNTARQRAEAIWNSAEVRHIYPTDATVPQFLAWLAQHQLGRKRLLDTLLAATYHSNGIGSILTLDVNDFQVFGQFQILEP
jgi:predicted nucleic acid-binding protein